MKCCEDWQSLDEKYYWRWYVLKWSQPYVHVGIQRFLWSEYIHSIGLIMYINKLILYGCHFKAYWRRRAIIEAIRAQMVQTICRYSYLRFCIIAVFFLFCWTVMNCLIIYSIFLPLAGFECSQIGAKNSFSRALITQRGNA